MVDMAVFLEEDGTGITNATSYVSVAFADDYLGSDWAVDDATKQTNLMYASEYADLKFGKLLRSKPLTTTQGLEFPRYNLYDRYGNLLEGVPDEWKKAICLYAVEYNAGTLYTTTPTDSQQIKITEVSAGPVSKKVEFFGGVSPGEFKTFPTADKFASIFINNYQGVIRA